MNIPLAELPARTHELPPRGELVHVAGNGPEAQAAVAWLAAHGRLAELGTPDAPHRTRPKSSDYLAPVGRLWHPNAYLEGIHPALMAASVASDLLDSPTGATAADVACGTGRDAVFLASAGWRVTAIDVLPDALARGRALAAHCDGALEPIDWRVVNLDDDAAVAALLPEAQFGLVTCFRYLRRALFPVFARWLRPGGCLVCETFTAMHRARHGRPAAEADVLAPGELPQLVEHAGLRLIDASEDWRGAAHTTRVWAQKCPAAPPASDPPPNPSLTGRGV